MKTEQFNDVVNNQLDICKSILCKKADEYARDEDRLHNFKCAAGLLNCDPKEALCGMMVKHTVSVADMCRDGIFHPIELWDEKITDSINYLLLLKALVVEEKELDLAAPNDPLTDAVQAVVEAFRHFGEGVQTNEEK